MNGYDSNIICRQNQDLKENIITISRKRSQRILMYELNKQLFDIPHELYTFFNLRQVNYARNRISCIPADIGRLMQLREINLAGNQIESLPNEITNLINLIYIDLRKNHITQLPNDIGNLVNLIHILLDNNDLEEILNYYYLLIISVILFYYFSKVFFFINRYIQIIYVLDYLNFLYRLVVVLYDFCVDLYILS